MSRHAAVALLLLRVSIGALMLVWGMDKFVNPDHGMKVAERFYFGLMSGRPAMAVLGAIQVGLAVLVLAGALRRFVYPLVAAATGMTLLGVWRSIVDPWGWYLEGTNALFFPSLTIFAAVLVLITQRDTDRFAVHPYAGGQTPAHEPT